MYAPSGPSMSAAPPLAPTSGNDQLAQALLQLLPYLGVNAGQAIGALPPNGGVDPTQLLLEKMRQAQLMGGDPDAGMEGMERMMPMAAMPTGGMMGMASGLGSGMMPMSGGSRY